MKTAIIYARVSTSRQADEELPIQSQVDQCLKKCDDLDLKVLKTFKDEGISGSTDSRPAFQDAMLYCGLNDVDCFITWSSSRFARNKIDAGFYKKKLEEAGTRMIYVSMDVDTSTTGGWLLDSVTEIFDELYSRQVAADTLRSMVKNANEGYFNGGRTPFGFTAEPATENPKRKRLNVIPAEAIIVNKIFELKISGNGSRVIANSLNEMGHTNRGKNWNKSTVLALLKNENVLGRTVFGRKNKRSGKINPRSEWIIVNSHEPIINEDMFKAAQSLLNIESDSSAGSPHSHFVFTGILKCGVCGSSMQIETAKGRNKRYSYYNCRLAQQSCGCDNRRVSADALDVWLIDIITSKIFDRDHVFQIMKEMDEFCGVWVKDRDNRRKKVLRSINEIQDKNNKLYETLELFGKDAPNLGDLTLRLRSNNKKLKAIEQDLMDIDNEVAPVFEFNVREVDELSETLIDIVRTTTDEKILRHFFRGFINSITVTNESVKIEYDQTKLLGTTNVVPSKGIWLPEVGGLGTKRIEINLPDRFCLVKKASISG